MTLRLFAAIPIPDDVAAALAELQRGVDGAAWRTREHLHLTLRFFGAVEEPDARELDHELSRVRCAPFEVGLTSATWFGGERPTALVAEVARHEALLALAQDCERAARRAGLQPERRKFSPHITLAYCRTISVETAARFARRVSPIIAPPLWVDRFRLYSSWLGKGPSVYVDEAEYPLEP